ncbi:MAG: YiiD C-terminal domain-containing protein [Burkholderiales bacterium]|nr:YiiD C-terminal domain-containing protein [Burkholderiales bacterium]
MARDWTDLICSNIPLARAMQIGTELVDDGRVRLTAPLAPNVNDKGTGFGGSVATLATVAGWIEVQRQLAAADIDTSVEIVIQRGETRYLVPVTSDFSALVEPVDEASVDRFVRMFQKRGMARLSLSAEVLCQGLSCASFQGEYVVTRASAS